VACLAQLVNVIAPIMTNEDGLFRQTIYYPYVWALQYARGKALDLVPQSDTYEVTAFTRRGNRAGEKITVPYLDLAGTIDAQSNSVSLFILNRDLETARDLTVSWHEVVPRRVNTCHVLTGSDLKAVNAFTDPKRVAPQNLEAPAAGAEMKFQLPPRSYTLVNIGL